MQISSYFKQVNAEITKLAYGRDYAYEQKLEREAQAIIEEAYATKQPGNRTYNQHDAYYWALYWKGELIASGNLGKLANMKSGMMEVDGEIVPYGYDEYHYWGSESRERAIRLYAANTTDKGYSLLFGNAMWYSIKQEGGYLMGDRDSRKDWLFGLRERRKVLSNVKDRIQHLADEYGGIITNIHFSD